MPNRTVRLRSSSRHLPDCLLWRLFLDRSPPRLLNAAAPRGFVANVCPPTTEGLQLSLSQSGSLSTSIFKAAQTNRRTLRSAFSCRQPSRTRELHPRALTDSVRDGLPSYGSCHRYEG